MRDCDGPALNRYACDNGMATCVHKKRNAHLAERIDLMSLVLAAGEIVIDFMSINAELTAQPDRFLQNQSRIRCGGFKRAPCAVFANGEVRR